MTRVIENDTDEEIKLAPGEAINVVVEEKDSKSTVSRIRTWSIQEVRNA